ncbi:MAG TPA: hypothetical protein VHD32_00585 [Candidatus Didemnitutus sp.]|nr:hypothetical protein [Candidatus Didemnitutus sp.]
MHSTESSVGMLAQRCYYALKPFVPWKIRTWLRRFHVRRRMRAAAGQWPILPEAAVPPPGWTGWPNGKQFALILTHDVERAEGLAQCRRLAELERELGFRSSFNFVPEGTYRTPSELREWLGREGFEVGVHDLNHDGWLFGSSRSFLAKARRINHYLREWKADGFRAGFMLRNLDWMHHLQISYDSSTFDTDPFEFQPDGAKTIFPFWIPTPTGPNADPALQPPGPGDSTSPNSRGGYLELPYTLPQDSTLYLVLQESSPRIWIEKLDWIASQGGMALVNVHPDYLDFDHDTSSPRRYPASWYQRFLRHVLARYPNAYWNPLARELTAWHRELPSRGMVAEANETGRSLHV